MLRACMCILPSKLTWWGPEFGAKDKVEGQFSNSMPSCSNANPMSLTSIGRGLYKVKQTSETSLATHWKLTLCFCSFPPKLRGVKTKTLSLFFLCPFPILGTRWLGSGHTKEEGKKYFKILNKNVVCSSVHTILFYRLLKN